MKTATPDWVSTATRPAQDYERREQLDITDAVNIAAFSYGECGYWYAGAHVRLPICDGRKLTDAHRLEMLQRTLAAIDEARPVLLRLIQQHGQLQERPY